MTRLPSVESDRIGAQAIGGLDRFVDCLTLIEVAASGKAETRGRSSCMRTFENVASVEGIAGVIRRPVFPILGRWDATFLIFCPRDVKE